MTILVLVGWLAYNTEPGKRLLAELGLVRCVEIVFSGNVVCGDDADRLLRLKRNMRNLTEEARPARVVRNGPDRAHRTSRQRRGTAQGRAP